MGLPKTPQHSIGWLKRVRVLSASYALEGIRAYLSRSVTTIAGEAEEQLAMLDVHIDTAETLHQAPCLYQ